MLSKCIRLNNVPRRRFPFLLIDLQQYQTATHQQKSGCCPGNRDAKKKSANKQNPANNSHASHHSPYRPLHRGRFNPNACRMTRSELCGCILEAAVIQKLRSARCQFLNTRQLPPAASSREQSCFARSRVNSATRIRYQGAEPRPAIWLLMIIGRDRRALTRIAFKSPCSRKVPWPATNCRSVEVPTVPPRSSLPRQARFEFGHWPDFAALAAVVLRVRCMARLFANPLDHPPDHASTLPQPVP